MILSNEIANETGLNCSAATLERLAEIGRGIAAPTLKAQAVFAEAAAQSPYVKKQKAQKSYCKINLDPGHLRQALLPRKPRAWAELSNAPAIDLLADCLASHAPPVAFEHHDMWQVPRE